MDSLRCRATAAPVTRPLPLRWGWRLQLGLLVWGLSQACAAQTNDAATPQACAVSRSDTEAAEPPEAQLREAECALQTRRYADAARLYQNLLQQGDDPIFHAELGRAYLGLQDFEHARAEFLLALASHPPPEAQALLQMFLQMADQQRTQAKTWMATLSWGLMHDNNSNQGPRSAQVELFGLPFTMNADGLPRASNAAQASLNLVHNAALQPDLLWQSNLNGASTRYSRNHAMDLGSVALDTGPRWAMNAQGDVLYVPVGYSRVDLDGQNYIDSRTVTPQWSRQFSPADQGLASLTLARNRHPQSDGRSSVARSLAWGWRHLLGGRWALEAGLRQGAEEARDSAFSNRQKGVSLALSGSPAEGWRLGANLAWTQYRYRDAEAWASAPRHDLRLQAGWQIARAIPGGYYLSVSGSLTRVQSNLALYTSLRRQTQAQISKSF